MPVNRYGGLSTDTTLGGASPSDEVISSQKAIKTYFKNNTKYVSAGKDIALYTELKYISSTGSQYIDTGKVFNSNYTYKFKYQRTGSYATPFAGYRVGSAATSGQNCTFTFMSQDDCLYYATSSLSSSGVSMGGYDSNIHEIIFCPKDSKLLRDNVSKWNNSFLTSEIISTQNFYLFNDNRPTMTTGLTGNIFSFQVSNGSTLVQNLVPCKRNIDNVLGMYDTVSGMFLTNSGSGSFTAGEETGYVYIGFENNEGFVKSSSLATVATSGSYNDLSNKPTIPTVNNATLTIQKNSTQVATFTANSSSNVTANITVPTDTNDLTNGARYITGITSSDVTTALGYTPYDSSNPAGYTSNTGTVTSVNNVSPVNGNVSLSIPTVNNPTITITQGGVTKGSFTLNQSTGDTIALDAGGGGGLPSQTGNAGKFLTTDGTDASWGRVKTNNLFDSKWCDYELNDQNWLRADTFSWQDGTVYSEAYSHLVADYTGGTAKTETVGSYTISYVEATDGHKITTDETTVANIYNETGIAWYYVLDTTNQRFKLPRTKWGFVGVRDSVGKYVEESLPALPLHTTETEASGYGLAGSSYFVNRVLVDNAYSPSNYVGNSTTYQNNAKVQQQSTQMYLYFYVGEFSQSATEQTAGITTEQLNAKLDLDLGNATNTSKEAIVGFNIPNYANGSGYTENTTFYADKDYYVVCSVVNGNYYGNIYADSALQTNLFGWQFYIQASANACRIPVCVLPKGTYYTSNAHCFLFPLKGES